MVVGASTSHSHRFTAHFRLHFLPPFPPHRPRHCYCSLITAPRPLTTNLATAFLPFSPNAGLDIYSRVRAAALRHSQHNGGIPPAQRDVRSVERSQRRSKPCTDEAPYARVSQAMIPTSPLRDAPDRLPSTRTPVVRGFVNLSTPEPSASSSVPPAQVQPTTPPQDGVDRSAAVDPPHVQRRARLGGQFHRNNWPTSFDIPTPRGLA